MHKPRFLALPLFPLAILPFQDQPEVVKNQRKLELQQRQESYKWGTFAGWEGLPRHLEAAQHSDIPRDSQFSQEARNSIDEDRKKAVIDLGLAHLSTVFESWDNFDDCRLVLWRRTTTCWRRPMDDRQCIRIDVSEWLQSQCCRALWEITKPFSSYWWAREGCSRSRAIVATGNEGMKMAHPV